MVELTEPSGRCDELYLGSSTRYLLLDPLRPRIDRHVVHTKYLQGSTSRTTEKPYFIIAGSGPAADTFARPSRA